MNDRRSGRGQSLSMKSSERATTLVLVPAMMLVFIVLGAIGVDMSAMHMCHRRIHTAVSLAADDAAGMLDEVAMQTEGSVRIDPRRAHRVAVAHIAAADLPGELAGEPLVQVSSDGRRVEVEVSIAVEHIFLRSIPNMGSDVMTVRSSGRLIG